MQTGRQKYLGSPKSPQGESFVGRLIWACWSMALATGAVFIVMVFPAHYTHYSLWNATVLKAVAGCSFCLGLLVGRKVFDATLFFFAKTMDAIIWHLRQRW